MSGTAPCRAVAPARRSVHGGPRRHASARERFATTRGDQVRRHAATTTNSSTTGGTAGWRRRRTPPGEALQRASASLNDGDALNASSAHVVRHFVNLKNGIEAVPDLESMGWDYDFVRVQSTNRGSRATTLARVCEVGDMEKVLLELDANFLMAAALGHSCMVYDYGSRDRKRGAPRALWYGLEFVRFALNTTWFGEPDRIPVLRGKNVQRDFKKKLDGLSKSTKKRLKYYRKFIPQSGQASSGDGKDAENTSCVDGEPCAGAVRLVGVYKFTEHDDDDGFYVESLHASGSLPRLGDEPWIDRVGNLQQAIVGGGIFALGEPTRRESDSRATAGGQRRSARRDSPHVNGPRARRMTERQAVAALRARGFEIFYAGDAEEEWLEQITPARAR